MDKIKKIIMLSSIAYMLITIFILLGRLESRRFISKYHDEVLWIVAPLPFLFLLIFYYTSKTTPNGETGLFKLYRLWVQSKEKELKSKIEK